MAGAIAIEGLRPALRDLKRLAPEGAKALRDAFAHEAQPLAHAAGALAPRGKGTKKKHLGDSVTAKMRGSLLVIRVGLPYANVIHWGGSTGRGHRPGAAWSGSVRIQRGALFVQRAHEEHEDDLLEGIAREYDKALRQHGFK